MAPATNTAWQFSLRRLLLVMLVAALLLGAANWLDKHVFMGALFVVLSVLPVIKMSPALARSYLASYAAVYGPFFVMATYTLLFVSCSHCKLASWQFLPYGPAVIPLWLVLHQWLDLPQFSGLPELLVPALVAAGMVAGLTWNVHTGGRWWKIGSVILSVAACSYFAFVVLAIIRS
jgi:hypothetical protein